MSGCEPLDVQPMVAAAQWLRVTAEALTDAFSNGASDATIIAAAGDVRDAVLELRIAEASENGGKTES